MPQMPAPRLAASIAPALRRCGPLLVLLAALATLFPLLDESGPLHRPERGYDTTSFDHLAVAKNLSAEHGWLGFYARTVDVRHTDEHTGEVVYEAYNRFPPAGYFLIKLALLTRPGDLHGQVQAARMLMLAFFAGAAVLAWASLVLITGRRWLAVSAALAAFGSYTALYACDMVATEGAPDLFGAMLAFHGIARYHFPGAPGAPAAPGERRRFGQMLAKACAALLLGWHVCALLAPFLALGLAAALAGRDRAEFRRLALFGALALLFALAVLAQNLARERFALGGGVALWDLPSFESARRRSVVRGILQGDGLWLAFAADQLRRTGLALVPYAATRAGLFWPGWTLLGGLGLAAVLGAALAAARGGGGVARRRARAACLALVPLAAAGHVWAVGMRGSFTSFRCPPIPEAGMGEDIYEAMFHVGAPLALFALLGPPLAAAAARRVPRPLRRAGAAAGVAALWLAFAASAFHMGRLDRDVETAKRERALHDDVLAVRRALPAGSVVHFTAERNPVRWRSRFYFAGHVLARSNRGGAAAEFVVAPRIPGAPTPTPGNRRYFLYSAEEYRRHRGPPWRLAEREAPIRPGACFAATAVTTRSARMQRTKSSRSTPEATASMREA